MRNVGSVAALGAALLWFVTSHPFTPFALATAEVVPDAIEAPLADAYARAGPYASTNFGSSAALIVKAHDDPQWQRETYLKFDIGGVQAGHSVMLRLFGRLSDTRHPSVTTAVHPVSDTSWTERGITWNNRPAASATAIATFAVSGISPRWYEVEITPHVQAERSAGRMQISLALRGITDTLPYAGFNSREAGNGPELIVSSGAPPPAVTLVRGPYLQQTTDTSTVIVWATREPGPASVTYWTSAEQPVSVPAQTFFYSSSTTGVADYHQHEATLTGLRPSTSYSYDLRVDGADATPGVVDRLRTAPPGGTGTVRFIAFGDSGTGSSAQGQVAALMGSDIFDFALHSGDIAYSNGTFAEFDARFFPYYRGWLRERAFFSSIGNHEDRTNHAAPYRSLFVLPENGWSPTFSDHAERYYSFDYGPLHVVVLDTELAFLSSTRRQAQVAWLDADLQAAQHQPWRIALFHRPPYSAGSRHGSDLAVRQAFQPLFERHDVQFVIVGHEHNYERTVPWRENPDAGGQAVTYIVTGGGGAALYSVGQAAWTALSRSAHHYVRATFSASQAAFEAIGLDGRPFDHFSLDRDLQNGDVTPPTVSITAPPPGAVLSGVEKVQASAADDVRVEKVDLWVNGTLEAIDLTAPYTFSLDTRTLADGEHTLEARAYDIDGRRAVATQTVRVLNHRTSDDVVLYVSEAAVRTGRWREVIDESAAGGSRMESPYTGDSRVDPPLANPADYFEMRFTVEKDRPYRLWMRGRAHGDSGYRDSAWAQFSGSLDASGSPVYRIGTTSAAWFNLEACRSCGVKGWGWQDNGFGAFGPEISFAATGVQTIRVQIRENGLSIDQIVLSPGTFLWSAPGAAKLDTTILPKQGGLDGTDAVLGDAYVRAGSYAASSFGSAPELIVKDSTTTENRRETYLKFDISGVRSDHTVALRLLGWLSDTRVSSVRTNVYPSDDVSWTEGALTWNTKPLRSSTLLGSILVSGTAASWYSVDLTSYVQAQRSAGRTMVTIVLSNPEHTSPYVAFSSRESGSGPELMVAR